MPVKTLLSSSYSLIYIFIFIFACESLSIAKTINRKAYKVCKEQETAYWNGSSAGCCDTTANYALVKNYIDGQTETPYICCKLQEDDGDYTDYTVVGAVNGTCCGGYAKNEYSMITPDDADPSKEAIVHFSHTETFSVQKNQGGYYCGSEYKYIITYKGETTTNVETKLVTPEKWCFYNYLDPSGNYCVCSSTGDPENGEICS